MTIRIMSKHKHAKRQRKAEPETNESSMFRTMLADPDGPEPFYLFRGQAPNRRYYCDRCRQWHQEGERPAL